MAKVYTEQMEDGLIRFRSVADRALGGEKLHKILPVSRSLIAFTRKKASIKQARLPRGLPDWDTLMRMTSEQIEAGARANTPGFKVVRKLLTDKRFDK
jgi:hypothetical protein